MSPARVSEAQARRLAEHARAPQDAPKPRPRRGAGAKAQKPAAARPARPGSARAKCVECGAIVGRGRKAATCAPCDLVALLGRAGLPAPLREVRFAWPERRWRFDLAWPPGLALEVDGGHHMAGGGRHNTDADREKLNEAAIRGWRLLRLTPAQIARDPEGCVALVRRALEVRI